LGFTKVHHPSYRSFSFVANKGQQRIYGHKQRKREEENRAIISTTSSRRIEVSKLEGMSSFGDGRLTLTNSEKREKRRISVRKTFGAGGRTVIVDLTVAIYISFPDHLIDFVIG